MQLTDDQLRIFSEQGHLVVRRLFSRAEVASYRDHFMRLRAAGTYAFDQVADKPIEGDPLKRFPRMIHMHRWDEPSRRWLLDRRLAACLAGLMGTEPLAVQSMVYFKPPGARGQALHQDQYYLNVRPGTCIAAWLALDPSDEHNGCMRVVPGSHTWAVLCAQKADPTTSFTDTTVELPSNQDVRPVVMDEGDVLFFNGLLVHGSLPNVTSDRFRRSLIGHYIPRTSTEVTGFDQPVLRMDGTELWLKAAAFGGPCGQWVDRDGGKVLEVSGVNLTPTWTHE